MSHAEDTQIKDGRYEPGMVPEGNKWRVETDSLGSSSHRHTLCTDAGSEPSL